MRERKRSLLQEMDRMMKNEALSESKYMEPNSREQSQRANEHSLSMNIQGHSADVMSEILKDKVGRNDERNHCEEILKDIVKSVCAEDDLQCGGGINTTKLSDGRGMAGKEDEIQERSPTLCWTGTTSTRSSTTLD